MIAMKLEIDFSKPDSLRKQKRELEMALATIDGALAAINRGAYESVDQPAQPQMPEPEKSAKSVIDLISDMHI